MKKILLLEKCDGTTLYRRSGFTLDTSWKNIRLVQCQEQYGNGRIVSWLYVWTPIMESWQNFRIDGMQVYARLPEPFNKISGLPACRLSAFTVFTRDSDRVKATVLHWKNKCLESWRTACKRAPCRPCHSCRVIPAPVVLPPVPKRSGFIVQTVVSTVCLDSGNTGTKYRYDFINV